MSDPVAELGIRLHVRGYEADALATAVGGLELSKVRLLGPAFPIDAEEPLLTLVELFYLVRPVPRERAQAALETLSVDALAEAGLLTADGDTVVATLQISYWFGALVLHDVLEGSDPPPDYVAGGTVSAETLARSTVRVPLRRGLDLGTGSGVQALLAARHCEHVVATDVNPHAVELTRLNARLNGLDNVEGRVGSWLEPVEGELFDLIVANPPYVLSPDTELLFRDGDRSGDGELLDVTGRVVRGVAEHLAPGGIAHVLCDWGVGADGDRYAPLRELTAELGCDVCVVDFGSQKSPAYAARWNDLLSVTDPARYAEAVQRWLAFYARHGVTTIRFGLVVLRRGFGSERWFHAVEAAGAPQGEGGGQLLRILEAQDYLNGSSLLAPELVEERLRVMEGHRITERTVFRDGVYEAEQPTLTLLDGLGTLVTIDNLTEQLLDSIDPGATLGETIAQLAAQPGVDRDDLARYGVELVRTLFELGIVERA